jgi:hypothetical protein
MGTRKGDYNRRLLLIADCCCCDCVLELELGPLQSATSASDGIAPASSNQQAAAVNAGTASDL